MREIMIGKGPVLVKSPAPEAGQLARKTGREPEAHALTCSVSASSGSRMVIRWLMVAAARKVAAAPQYFSWESSTARSR